MWILVSPAFGIGKADCSQRRQYALAPRRSGQPLMMPEHLGDLITDSDDGIETRHRLLKDHCHAPSANFAHGHFRIAQQILAAQPHGAAADASRRRRYQLHDGQGRHRLAAAGFAEQRVGFARVNREADAVHRPGRPLAHTERGVQIFDA